MINMNVSEVMRAPEKFMEEFSGYFMQMKEMNEEVKGLKNRLDVVEHENRTLKDQNEAFQNDLMMLSTRIGL